MQSHLEKCGVCGSLRPKPLKRIVRKLSDKTGELVKACHDCHDAHYAKGEK